MRDPKLRTSLTFGYMFENNDDVLPFKAGSIYPTISIKADERTFGSLKLVHLPGHISGQTGLITPDGVLYAGDSIFGDKVLSKYGIPYHQLPCKSIESLNELLKLSSNVDFIIPSHGPILKSSNAVQLIEGNIKKLIVLKKN